MSTSHAAAMGFFHSIAQACRRALGIRSEATETVPNPAPIAMAMAMWSSPQMRFANDPTFILEWNDEGKGGATGTRCPEGCSRSAPFWLVQLEPETGKTTWATDIFSVEHLQRFIDRYGLKVSRQDWHLNVPRVRVAALALNPDENVVQILLDGGVDVNTQCEWGDPRHLPVSGQTALHATPIPRRVDQLVRAGANVNARDTEGNTPLHIAAARIPEQAVALVSALLAAGADPWVRNDCGLLPDEVASNVRVAKILREARDRA